MVLAIHIIQLNNAIVHGVITEDIVNTANMVIAQIQLAITVNILLVFSFRILLFKSLLLKLNIGGSCYSYNSTEQCNCPWGYYGRYCEYSQYSTA